MYVVVLTAVTVEAAGVGTKYKNGGVDRRDRAWAQSVNL